MDFPKSIADPDPEQKLFNKLSQDQDDYAALEYIRRHMRYIYVEEQKKGPRSDDTSTKVS